MAITFRDEKGAPLTHEELDANFRSFFFTASFGANQLLLQRKDGTSLTVPIGGEAFADFQANGGSIGDVYIANSEVTGSRMIINLFSGSFYDKTKGPGSDGGNLNSDEWYITFNPQSSANYYVHFGSNFAISSSGYMHASGAVIEGNITASAGLIGGFNITPDAIVGPETLGVPSFYMSGSASTSGYFISASAFNIKGNGEITGSDVLFTGGNIAGWDITNTQIRKSTNIVLDASDNSFSINNATYGNAGIQLQYNGGTPRFHVGDGSDSFVKFDGTDVSVSTRLLEISASNIEISSTEASMSLGGGNIKLLGGSSTIEVGTTNKVSITGGAADAFIAAGSKTTFGQNSTAGIIMGMDSNVPTFDLTKDAGNYVRFDTTSGVDIKTDTFKLDTTYFDIDTSTQRLNIFDTASAEIIRLGEISDDASDLYGIKIYDGSGTGSADTIAMFGQQGNKIGGWEVTDSQIRSIPNSGFGGTYAEGETGLIIHSSGRLESSNFVTNVKGWRIDTLGNGSAEFENMRIRGTLKTTVFEKESVNVVGGQLMVANATTIQPLRSEAGTIIAGSSSYADTAVTFSVANVSGFEVGEILKAKSVDDTGFSVEYMYVSGSKRYSQDGSISYNTGSIDPDGLAGEIYVQRAFGGVPAVSSSVTTLAEDLDDQETDITVASTASLSTQDIIKINDERFKITSISTTGNVLTVIRDYHDTVADSHTNGATIYLIDNDKEFLAGLVSSAQPYNEGQVLVSTGVYNPEKDITSGYIVMNANPRDISTPYMDIVERTGSGVYDLQLRSRLGDLSGLSSAYLYGDDEPGFGIYTENGYFKGAITAQTGSIAGILHVATVQGGLETGQKISIGRDVSGTNDGIYVNNNNYWYTDGAWKVGGSNNFISLDNFTDGNLTIKTETFTLDTSTFMISSSLNSGTLTAGTNASTITNTAGDGIYMDGTGKFRVGTATSGDNYIYWDGSTLNIKGSVDISGGSAASEAYVNTAASSSISASNAFTNDSTASLSGSVATVTDTLDGKIFTDSSGRAVRPPTASATGLYLTSTNLGFYESGTWKTYMDNTGDFFLTGSAGNKLAWDADAGTLEIKGNITITGGNAATQDFVNTATGSLSGSLASSISSSNASLSDSIASNSSSLASDLSDLDAVASGKASIFRQGTSPSTSGRTVGDVWIHTGQQNKMYIWNGSSFVASSDGTYDQAALINSTSASLSSSVALDIFTDSSGKLVRTPNTSSAGLYLGDTNLGFYSGSEWKTYMANNGNFYLTGSDSNYLAWDGTSLTIAGSINITGGNAVTQANLDTATGSLETYADNAASTAESNANSFTNLATASLSGSITSSLGAISASLANDVSASEAYTVYVSASQAAVNEATTGFLAGKNSIFRQDDQPSTSGRVDGDIWIDTNSTPANKVYVWATNQFIATPDGTYDQSSDINNLSGSVAADIFTDSSGKIVRAATLAGSGLFMDDTNLGYYANGEWKTFMSNNGNFFLTASNANSYLTWQNGTLTVAGSINVTGGNAATNASLEAATGSLQTYADNAANEASSSLTGSINQAQSDATTASGTATQAAQTAASASALANTAVTRSVDADGKITFNPAPSGTGLIMNADNIGFYNNSYWGAYISASGDFYLSGSGNSGLSWDGSDLSVDGTIVARDGSIGGIELDADKMYIGTGTYNNANTAFFVSSSGKFSLKDKLVWDGSNLAIAGSITISNPGDIDISTLNNDSGFTDDTAANAAQTTANTATGSAASAQATANQATGSAAAAQATANEATASAATAQASVDSINAVTSSLANPTSYAFGAGSGAFDLATATAAAGLNLTSQYLGYHDGSNFKSYMDSSGNFYLTGDGDDALSWDGSNLRIGNRGVGPTITYQFSGSLDDNVFDYTSTITQVQVDTPVLGSKFFSGTNGGYQGFQTKAVFDRNDGPTFEWDIVVGDANPNTYIGLIKENAGSYNRNQYRHAIRLQGRDISIWENDTEIIPVAAGLTDDWANDPDFSENQQYRLKITLLEAGARYEVYKNGDFTSPHYVTESAANNVTAQYTRAAATLYYSEASQPDHALIFRGLAAGAQLGAATKISGNTIQTGKILSSNHAGTSDGSAMSTTGMAIDLDNGAISAKNFRIASDGSAVFSGTMQIGGTNLTANNTLNTNTTANDVGLGNVDNTSDATVLNSAATAANTADKTDGTVGGWTIHADKIFTGTDENVSTYTSTAGRLIISASGAIHSKSFYMDKNGNAGFRGTVTIGSTDLTENNTLNSNTSADDVGLGNVDNTSDATVLSNAATAANEADKTEGSVGGWTIHSDKIFTGADENTGTFTSAAGRLIISSSGAIHAKEFYIDKAGNAKFKGDLEAAGGTFAGSLRVGTTNTTVSDVVSGAADGASSLQPGDAASDVNNNSTTISGNKIRAGSILSNNHSGTADGSGFSTAGMAIDLTNGAISTPNFSLASNGDTYFGGLITANAGINGSTIQGATINAGQLTGGNIVGGDLAIPNATAPNFSVDTQGFMSASDANISGEITATSGRIGDWIIDPTNNALRDDNSEIIFEPNIPEIQMYAGGEKKVIISPLGSLTGVAGGSTPVNVSGITSGNAMESITSTNIYSAVYNNRYGSQGATFSAVQGEAEITITTPSFSVDAPTNHTNTVTQPSYSGTSEGQLHGFPSNFYRKTHYADIYLEAVKDGTSTVVGSVLLGSAYRQASVSSHTYWEASGSQSTTSGGGGGLNSPSSVVGTAEIELHDGSTKQAKDIVESDVLKVWDWQDGVNKISAGSIKEIRNRTTSTVLKVTTETKTVTVTDDHGFWLDENKQIKSVELVPNESEIYVAAEGGIKKEKVLGVETIYKDTDVYTFVVPGYQNYISDGILSHNPTTTTFAWVQKTRAAQTGTNVTHTGGSETVTMTISETTNVKFRYRVRSGAKSGYNIAVNALNSTTNTQVNTTLGTDGFGTQPSYDTQINVAVPTNFVEVKAGGIQIVSDADQYVRAPRQAPTAGPSATILEAKGGTTITDALRPGTNGSFNLGTSSYRWNNVYSEAGNFSNGLTVTGAITATGNITAFHSSDERLKENIINLDGSLAKVLKLRGTRFDWKEGNEKIHPFKGNDIGFIAQEVKEVLPEVVGRMHEGYYGVRYEKLTPILVEAIKELSKKVDILEQKLKDKE